MSGRRSRPAPAERVGDAFHAVGDAVGSVGEAVGEAARDLAAAVKPTLRGVLHEYAFYVSLVAGLVLVVFSDPGRARWSAAVYAASATALFGTSALYHRRTWSPRARAVMRRLDHAMIFVLIAGTYTPFATLVLEGTASVVVLSVVWIGAVAGIAMRVSWPGASRWLALTVYLALSYVGVFVFPQLLDRGGAAVLGLVLTGGVLYSVGGVVYAAKRPNPSPRVFGYHEVFHALTLAAFVVHYIAVSLATYGAGSS